jgi:hypothetical protein
VTRSFVDGARKLAAAHRFDSDSFAACVIYAYNLELAQAALRHPDFSDQWLADVSVDRACRPLVKWVSGVAWTGTDIGALDEAQAEQRRAERARIEAELAALRRQRLATL